MGGNTISKLTTRFVSVSVQVAGVDAWRTCAVTRIGIDGLFVRGLKGVVPDDRVRIRLNLPDRSGLDSAGVVRRVVSSAEANERKSVAGVTISWVDPPPELMACVDELIGFDESPDSDQKAGRESDLVARFNSGMGEGAPLEALEAARLLRQMRPDVVGYRVAYELALGLCCRASDDVAAAEECFRRALDIDPTCEQAAILLRRRRESDPTDAPEATAVVMDQESVRFRRYHRHPVRLDAEVRRADGAYRMQSSDLSEGGMFFPTSRGAQVGSVVSLRVQVPGHAEDLELSARVARVVGSAEARASGGSPGIGVEFVGLEAPKLSVIRSVLESAAPPRRAAG